MSAAGNEWLICSVLLAGLAVIWEDCGEKELCDGSASHPHVWGRATANWAYEGQLCTLHFALYIFSFLLSVALHFYGEWLIADLTMVRLQTADGQSRFGSGFKTSSANCVNYMQSYKTDC